MSVYGTDSASGPRILVVDDDPDMRALLTRTLEQRGYRVEEADSAERALEVCQAGPQALAIVDIRLPGGTDGCELIDQIRERFGSQAPPAVLLSVYVDQEYPKLGPGVVGALPKAFSLERLLELVETHAGRASA